MTEAWPYRPAEIYATDITDGAYPHELLGFDPLNDVYPVGVQRYDDGSILVNFQQGDDRAFPFGMGITRVGKDGMPRWNLILLQPPLGNSVGGRERRRLQPSKSARRSRCHPRARLTPRAGV